MILAILLFMAGLQPQQVEQELRRQQQQLEQIHQQLQQLTKIVDLLDRQEKRDRDRPKAAACSAELRWVTGGQDLRVPPNAGAVVNLNLFSTVSRPPDTCLAADVLVTASYLDGADNLICSGAVDNVAIQNALAQSVNLEIRPWNLREFVRWRNEPRQNNSGAKRLVCLNPEGLAEATPEELARVSSVRVRTTVLPAAGGMSTAEIKLTIR